MVHTNFTVIIIMSNIKLRYISLGLDNTTLQLKN